MKRVEGVKYILTRDETLGGERTVKYTNIFLKCTHETYIMLSLANITQINLIKKQSYSHLEAFIRHMYYSRIQIHVAENPSIMAPKIGDYYYYYYYC